MPDPIVEAARREFDQLLDEEKELDAEADQLEMRRAQIAARKKDLSEFFRLAQSLTQVNIMVPTGKMTISTGSVDVAEKSYKDTILTKVEALLRVNKYLSTRAIVGMLQDAGVDVRGDDMERKIMRTSVILNKDGRFKADRKVGWSLKKQLPQPRNGAGAVTPPVSPNQH